MAFSFLKKGAESAQLAQKAAAEAEQRKQEQGKLFRFWLKLNETARITFVDGDLSAEGFLLPSRYYEHNMYEGGRWNNFYVCPQKTNPQSNEKCPLCEGGDRPSLVALFTVIDHREYKGKNDKVYKDLKRLMVVKNQTFEILNKLAVKRGGLAGCTFDVSRIGDKAASVGSMFDFVEKRPIEELKKKYMVEVVDPKTNAKTKKTLFEPADYEFEITYRTGDELRKMGKGAPNTGPTVPSSQPDGEQPDYSDQL